MKDETPEAALSAWRPSRSMLRQRQTPIRFQADWCRFVDQTHDRLSTRAHRHAIFELHCLLRGRAHVYFEDGRAVDLDSRQFLLIPPQVSHRFSFDTPDTLKLVAGFTIQPRPAAEVGALPCQSHDQSVPMRHMIDALLCRAEQPDAADFDIALPMLQCIALECFACLQPRAVVRADDAGRNASDEARMDAVRHFIACNLPQPLTGSEVAAHMGMSLRHLNRVCQAVCHCTVYRLVQDMRIQHAQMLLETAPLSLSDIAESMNYSSVYAFIRAFKRSTGGTPGKYKREAKGR